MPIVGGCCCFETLKRGSRASAIFTMVIATCNIAIDIPSLVRLHGLWNTLEPQESWLYLPPGLIPLIYIELAFSVGLWALGVILLIGINYGIDGKRFIVAWLIGVVFDRFYDVFLGVYILAWIGGHRFSVAAILCVVSYWQELEDDLYGKERRMKYYTKMANIRSAALSGAATPYRSYFGSRSTLATSQGNLNPAYVHKY